MSPADAVFSKSFCVADHLKTSDRQAEVQGTDSASPHFQGNLQISTQCWFQLQQRNQVFSAASVWMEIEEGTLTWCL